MVTRCCTCRLEDAANCSLVSQVLLDVLRGPNYPQYVASFGNSPLENPLDWVQIQNVSLEVRTNLIHQESSFVYLVNLTYFCLVF